jgi:putative nucleotidyltransferase with HDIG domain
MRTEPTLKCATQPSCFTPDAGKPALYPPAKNVLFVDCDRTAFDGLKRLFDDRAEWQIVLSLTGQEALQKLENHPFDVVVADMGTPGGYGLLMEVLRRYPNIVRIALADKMKHDLTGAASAAHQCLVKPYDAATLHTKLERALQVRRLLAIPVLRELISRLTSLPSLPSVHTKLIQSLEDPELSSRELGQIIAQDVGMAAKVLQLANSVYFGLYRYIASPTEAAIYLGTDTIRALTLSAGVFSAFPRTEAKHFSISELQRHSMQTGIAANAIATAENLPKRTSDCSLVGGLLHDIGKLILAANCPHEYDEILAAAKAENGSCHEVERRMLGTSHAEIGAYLLWLWGLPDAVCDAVAFHHTPANHLTGTFSAATAIHVADALSHETEAPTDFSGRPEIDMNHLQSLGVEERLPEWRRILDKFSDRWGQS